MPGGCACPVRPYQPIGEGGGVAEETAGKRSEAGVGQGMSGAGSGVKAVENKAAADSGVAAAVVGASVCSLGLNCQWQCGRPGSFVVGVMGLSLRAM